MAITKERLQELINEGATIYGVPKYDKKIYKLNAKNYSIDDNELNYLFETKEQAEWYLKYHATRTEELDLPTWEEFKSGKKVKFIDFYGHHYTFEMKDEDYIWLTFKTIFDDSEIIVKFDEPATEENYIKACDLCLKLFKGEV